MIANDQIVTRAKIRLGIKNTSEHDIELRLYVNEGAKSLFATNVKGLKCKQVDIDCYKASVPKDFRFFTFHNEDGCSCSQNCAGTCGCPQFYYFVPSSELAFVQQAGFICGNSNLFTYNLGELNFPSSVNATSCIVYYMGYNEDDDGFMLLDEDWERALSAYAAFQFSSTAFNINRFNPEFRSRVQQEWTNQFSRLTGEKFVREFINSKNSIRNMMANSLVYYGYNYPGGVQR